MHGPISCCAHPRRSVGAESWTLILSIGAELWIFPIAHTLSAVWEFRSHLASSRVAPHLSHRSGASVPVPRTPTAQCGSRKFLAPWAEPCAHRIAHTHSAVWELSPSACLVAFGALSCCPRGRCTGRRRLASARHLASRTHPLPRMLALSSHLRADRLSGEYRCRLPLHFVRRSPPHFQASP